MKSIRQLFPLWLGALALLAGVGQARAASLPDFAELVEQNSAAVVNISTKQAEKAKRVMPHGFNVPDIPEDSPFHDFLKRFFGEELGQQDDLDDSRSLGSGFIVSEDGYVMTNRHVVEDADEIFVRLSDRREFVAKVVGSDKATDIALIKIDAKDLPMVRIGQEQRAAGGRVGARHRLAVRFRPLGHGRHRQRQGPQPAPARTTCPSSRPTWPSTRATRAGPCSTSRARSSGSTRRSTAGRAGSWDCPSPSPSKWR